MDEIPQPGFFMSAGNILRNAPTQQQSLPTNSAFSQGGIQFAIPESQPQQSQGSTSSNARSSRMTSFFSTQRKARQSTTFVDQPVEKKEEEDISKVKDFKFTTPLKAAKTQYTSRNFSQYAMDVRNYKPGSMSLNKREEQRLIEEQNAIEGANDLFGVTTTAKPVVLVRSSGEVARLTSNLVTNQLVAKTTPKSPVSHSDFERFRTQLVAIMKNMQPEDIGILLERLIFGALLPRTKMTGPGSAAALSNLPNISKGLANLDRSGGIGSPNSTHIKTIIDYVNGSSCSLYRNDVSVVNQVKNIVALLDAVRTARLPICFPVSTSFQDKEMSVSLNGLPTLENLKSFFATVKAAAPVEKAKGASKNAYNKRDEDMRYGEYDDIEDKYEF